jgi:hypothetical protein
MRNLAIGLLAGAALSIGPHPLKVKARTKVRAEELLEARRQVSAGRQTFLAPCLAKVADPKFRRHRRHYRIQPLPSVGASKD